MKNVFGDYRGMSMNEVIRCPYCGSLQTPRGEEYGVEVFYCETRREFANGGDMLQTLQCSVAALILECEHRIDHLESDKLILDEKRKTLIKENRRFILRLQNSLKLKT